MRAKVVLCFVLAWLNCVLAYQRKGCSDCLGYKSCQSAVTAIEKPSPSSDALLKSAFCGFDGAKLPMVCCSELTSASKFTVESVENHPNLHLLPESCGSINGDKIINIAKRLVDITGNRRAGGFLAQHISIAIQRGNAASILDGRTAGLYEYPWMTLISFKTRLGPQFECGGSLINERYVLTAAHCIVGLKLLGVRIGENDVETMTDCQGDPPIFTCESKIQDIRIEQAIPHPEYQGQPTIRNDIGLIRLKKPVDLSVKNAGVICLPVSRQLQNRNIGGLHATVAGWGYTEKGYTSSKLLAVNVPVHTAESCRELYNRGANPGVEDVTINKICAGGNGKDSCGGDSGGPLMVKGSYRNSGERFIQHGIVSYGPRLCGSDFPGVYTDVSKYMKWILDTIKP